MEKSRNKLRIHRRKRVQSKIRGTAKKPRLCVFRSLRNIFAQVIDDSKGKTLASINLKEIKNVKYGLEGAKKAGELLAKKCSENKINEVVFDRNGYKYHGNVKALAEGAREKGLKF